MKKSSIGVLGSKGRMGIQIKKCIQQDYRFEIKNSRSSYNDSLEIFFKKIDVAIDFSVKDAFLEHLEAAEFYKVPLVVGTTGIDVPQKKPSIPLFISPNMSLAVAFMTDITKKMASFFKNFDIEITEEHHRHKIDAPSGTALMLGEAAAQGRDIPFKKAIDREGKRDPHTIGFSILRAGQLPGTHTVHFISDDERISLSHTAYSRSIFAKGALDVAEWLIHKPSGLYTMEDFLKEKLGC